MLKLSEHFWAIDQFKEVIKNLNNVSFGRGLQPIQWEPHMGCPVNLYDMIMPSSEDMRNRGALEVFQPIFLERFFNKALTVCAIRIEAGDNPGARVLCETYKSHELRERRWVEFASIDAAVVEAGRLVHNKIRNGFSYKLAPIDLGFEKRTASAIN
jgi:hypothetical protein